MPELSGLGPEFRSQHRLQPSLTRRRANRAIQLRSPQPMKEPPVHRPAIQRSQSPAIRIRQNRLTAKLRRDRAKTRSDLDKSLAPRNPLPALLVFYGDS